MECLISPQEGKKKSVKKKFVSFGEGLGVVWQAPVENGPPHK
jgi:hypothetical protein